MHAKATIAGRTPLAGIGIWFMRKILEEEPKTELSGLEQPHRTTVVSTRYDFSNIRSVFRGCNEYLFRLSQPRSSQSLCKIEQFCRGVLGQPRLMENKQLTHKQISSVPCPTCGVAVGKGCILYSGGLRLEPHLVRKISAMEALERK
jgi:hypothetical protein